jgi:hypothetical protein
LNQTNLLNYHKTPERYDWAEAGHGVLRRNYSHTISVTRVRQNQYDRRGAIIHFMLNWLAEWGFAR